MTIEEYINQKMQAFNVTPAQLADVSLESGLDLSMEYDSTNQEQVGKALCTMIEEMCFAPYQKSVSESGFSMSWDIDKLGKYYLWLCKKWGVPTNADTLSALGVNAIIDRTNKW